MRCNRWDSPAIRVSRRRSGVKWTTDYLGCSCFWHCIISISFGKALTSSIPPISCNNNVEAATEWLLTSAREVASADALAVHDAVHNDPASADVTGRGERLNGMEGERARWELVGGSPESPLSVLAGVNLFNIHDTGMGGWVVMNGTFGVAEPLLFVGEHSTW